MDRKNRNNRQQQKLTQLQIYCQWVVFLSFVINVVAWIMTGSERIGFGSMILGIFFGFLLYLGWYTDNQ